MIKNQKTIASNMLSSLKNFIQFIELDYIFATFCASFCLGSVVTLFTSASYLDISRLPIPKNFVFVSAISVITFLILIISVWITKNKKIIPITLLISCIVFGSGVAYSGSYANQNDFLSAELHPDGFVSYSGDYNSIYINLAIAFVIFFVVYWIFKDNKLDLTDINIPKNTEWVVAGILIIAFTIFVAIASIARYNSYVARNFDLGIFLQMFENMRTTGLPETTVERNVLMSHFGVHFSPFYYVILPFYMIYPRCETLLTVQALFVAIGVIPTILICKKLNFSRSVSLIIAVMYIFFPALSNGCLFDFHENKFLTVLLMWLFYFIVSEKNVGIIVFSLLTMSVKEDSAIYIMAIALYIIISRKKYVFGGGLLIGAIIYFIFATTMVGAFNVLGDGIMISRFENFTQDASGKFSEVFKTLISNFDYCLSQVFTLKKIIFMLWIFMPVAFAPFFSKNKSMFLLLIPMLVVNLIPNHRAQYNVYYQYTYGVVAIILFIFIVLIFELKENKVKQNQLLAFGVSMCIIMCFSLFVPRITLYTSREQELSQTTQQYNELISEIPTDAQITADGYYIPHMYTFKNLYQYPNPHGENIKNEYMLVNINNINNNTDGLADFMGNDYQFIKQSGNMVLYKAK